MEDKLLCEENYFSKEMQMHYIGSSQIKDFQECEAKALAKLLGEWVEEPSTSMLVGSYVDAHFSGSLDLFKAQHPEILKKDGDLKAEYVAADYIINRIERDEMMMKYLGGQKQTIFTGSISGEGYKLPVKVKIDSLFPEKAIVDLKIVRDLEPLWNDKTKEKQNFIDFWNYPQQASLYQEIVRQNTGKQLPYYIAVATKEKEPDIALLGIPQEVLDAKMTIIKEILPRIYDVKTQKEAPVRCEKCDYCKFTKKLTSENIIDYRNL